MIRVRSFIFDAIDFFVIFVKSIRGCCRTVVFTRSVGVHPGAPVRTGTGCQADALRHIPTELNDNQVLQHPQNQSKRNNGIAMKTISLLIPVFNEEKTLDLLADKVNSLMANELWGV